jgi:photosystem II stability/assembly factor-like uncharacterized protein
LLSKENIMKRELWLLSLMVLLLSAMSAQADWNFLPAGQPTVNSLAADSSGQRILVSVDGAGVWQTENGGTDWLPVSTRLSPDGRIQASIQMLDAGGDTILASLSTHAHLISCNGGATWRALTNAPAATIIISQLHHNEWYSTWPWSGPVSFRRSTDYGETWPDRLHMVNREPFTLALDNQRDSVVYMTAQRDPDFDGHGIWKSTERGVNWTQFQFPEPYDANWVPSDCGVLRLSNGYLADLIAFREGFGWTHNFDLWVSPDDGVTWTEAPSLTESGWHPNKLFESRNHPGRLIAADSARIVLSNDYGQSWNVFLDSSSIDGWWALLSQSAFNDDLYLAGRAGAFRSTNLGESWTRINLPALGGQGRFEITPERALFSSTDRGIPANWFQLAAPDSQWTAIPTTQTSPDTQLHRALILHASGDTLIGIGQVTLLRGNPSPQIEERRILSTDRGRSWTTTNVIPYDVGGIEVHVVRTDTTESWFGSGWMRTDDMTGLQFVSRDCGQTWDSLCPLPYWGVYVTATEVLPSADGALFEVVNGHSFGYALIYRSTDNGASWYRLGDIGVNPNAAAVIGNDLYVIELSSSHLFRWHADSLQDRGAIPMGVQRSWASHLLSVPGTPPLLVTTREGCDSLFISADSGATWDYRDYQLPYPTQNTTLGSLAYDPYRQRVWLSTGVGTCYLDVSELASNNHPLQFHPADFTLLKVYPNPFNSETRITYDLEQRGRVNLDLFNLQGQHVRSLSDAIQEPGRHELRFDGSSLSSGTYFVRLESPTVTRTEKILLLK